MDMKHVLTFVVALAIGAFIGIKFPQYVPFIGGSSGG
jgi:hypothetical protein